MTAASRTRLDAELIDRLKDAVSSSTPPLFGEQAVTKTHRRGWLVRRVLLVADVLGLTGAFLLAELATPSSGGVNAIGRGEECLARLRRGLGRPRLEEPAPSGVPRKPCGE